MLSSQTAQTVHCYSHSTLKISNPEKAPSNEAATPFKAQENENPTRVGCWPGSLLYFLYRGSSVLQLVHRLPTMACLKTTYHGLSKDHTPWLVHRLPSMACPKTTYQQGLSKDHIPIGFVQRPHTNGACPKNAYHGLFKGYLLITGHLPWVLQRPDTKACPYVTHKD